MAECLALCGWCFGLLCGLNSCKGMSVKVLGLLSGGCVLGMRFRVILSRSLRL